MDQTAVLVNTVPVVTHAAGQGAEVDPSGGLSRQEDGERERKEGWQGKAEETENVHSSQATRWLLSSLAHIPKN